MKMNHRFIYGILSIVLAAVIAFIAVPAITSKTSSTREIVRMKTAVGRGTLITAEDVELIEAGGFNMPESVASKTEAVIGTYAATDLFPGDYILPEKVSATPLSSDLALNEIPDGMVAISISTQTLAAALSDKLQSGDIIRLYHYDDKNALEPVTDIPELRFIKVLSVSDSKGLDIDYTTPPDDDKEKQQTAAVTVLATPEQAVLLTRCENEGILHAALICRGNEKLAAQLLTRQADILSDLYGYSPQENAEEVESLINAEEILPPDTKPVEETTPAAPEAPTQSQED